MDCSLPGSSIHGIFQARVLEWGAIAFSAHESRMYFNKEDVVHIYNGIFNSVSSITQSWSIAQSCLTLCDPMDCSMPGLPVYHQLPELAQTHVQSIQWVMSSNHLILCCTLFLPPSIFPSIRVFSKASVLCIRWPKHWSFGCNISPYNEYSGLISFRMDWLDLLADQGTLKSLLQHHSSKASILWHSAFFIVQFSHPYMTTGKTEPFD